MTDRNPMLKHAGVEPADPTPFCFFPSSRRICPIRSTASLLEFSGDMSGVSVPEKILKMESVPAYGSASVLKTWAENGAFAAMGRFSATFFFGLVPSTSPR